MNHPADEFFCWLVVQVSKGCPQHPGNIPFPEIKQRLHDFYNKTFEDGQEDEQTADKGLGGTR